MKWIPCCFLVVSVAQAQFTVEEMLTPYVYTNSTGETFPYRMKAPQFPAAGKKYPLILFLHGSGECGTDNLAQIKAGVPALMSTLLKTPEPVMVVAPQCQAGNRWVKRLAMREDYAASREPAPALEVALEICRYLVAERQADPDRLYITGLSLGGFGTWDAIQREPALFAAAIPVCGGGDIRRVQEIKKMPIWIFHGTEDKNVPVGCSRRMAEALKLAGHSHVRYTEYEKADHFIWDRVYADPKVIGWLLQQNKARKPWWKFWGSAAVR